MSSDKPASEMLLNTIKTISSSLFMRIDRLETGKGFDFWLWHKRFHVERLDDADRDANESLTDRYHAALENENG